MTSPFADALANLMRSRRSIRRYRPDPVSREIIERLLTAATWAPSAHNRQPWRFTVITAPTVKERLAAAMSDRLRADRARDGDSPQAIERDVRRSRDRLTHSPVIIVACLSMSDMDRYPDERRRQAERTMAIQSTALALQNLLLMAHATGLGACWMCAPLFCPESVQEALALPADWEAQALIALGYPADTGKPSSRMPLETTTLYLE